MGRTSKFSFPYPGRRHPSTETRQTAKSAVPSGHGISKAHKVLGTAGELNIDSPIREDSSSWKSFLRRPPSSGMSVVISESTQDDVSTTSSSANWHGDPNGGIRTKASSTILGRPYEDEDLTDVSSVTHRLHTEQSSSTLRSHYNAPLISRQTSASSVRDLALSKGSQPVLPYPRTPTLGADAIGPDTVGFEGQLSETASQSSRKKKPARLNLTKMILTPRKDGTLVVGPEIPARSTSVMQQIPRLPPRPQINPDDCDSRPSSLEGCRTPSRSGLGLVKQHDDLQSPSSRRNLNNRLSDLIEDLESRQRKSSLPLSSSIPQEARDPGRKRTSRLTHNRSNPRMRDGERPGNSESEDHTGWQDVRISIAPPSVKARSVASSSSRRSKTTKHNSNKLMSQADLRTKSVLSISSDEDSDEGSFAADPFKLKQSTQKATKKSPNKAPRSSRNVDNRGLGGSDQHAQSPPKPPQPQDGNYLTIPLPPLAGSRLSGPWDHTKSNKLQSGVPKRKDNASTAARDSSARDSSARLSILTKELQNVSMRSSRMMAVTKQEEALLEALRLKRLRMKETIIAEHETKRTPRQPDTQPDRKAIRDSDSTIRRQSRGESERVLLYLDTPASFACDIDTAEPSPDLSDFMSFGSDDDDDDDEESTPRTSWVMAKERARADSVTSPESESRDSPKTPQSAARLSAVGGLEGLSRERNDEGSKGVTFLEGVRHSSPDFLEESEVVWGM